jgi:H+/Na+-translocating ferredoxin:NAD+ oxidoreductase subunit C
MGAKSSYKVVTFPGGIHPDYDGKDLSRECAIIEAPLLDEYLVIVHQNIGAPPKVIVKPGDEVKKGQVIAEANGFVSVPLHAPTSGKIGKTTEAPGPMGINVPAILIESDGKDEWTELMPPLDWENSTGDSLKERIRDAGIVGMGGAAFPTHVKLSPPPDKKIDYMILNGAECEPYLTADHRLMLEQPEKVLKGAAILGKSLGVENIYIGVEQNKQNAIDTLLEKADEYNVKIIGLKVQYPQGAEKQLIYAATGRKVPAGGLPMESGCVVQNVATAAAVVDAVVEGKPLIERITTITGTPVIKPGNWQLRIGYPVAKALELAGGVKENPGKLILGGPMMGFAQKSLHVPIAKNSSGILLLSRSEVTQYESMPCIRCGKCVDACPMNILPGTLSSQIESEKFDLAEQYNVMDCIECGSCAYICPSNRPLVQHFRRAKAEINMKRRAQKK